MIQPLDLLLQVGFQLVIGLRQKLLLIRVLYHIPDALPLGGFQLLPQLLHDLGQMVGGLLGFHHIGILPCQFGVQFFQHDMGMLHDPPHIDFQQFIQLVHPDVVGAAPGTAPAVVGAAGVGGTQIPAAHGKHGAAAVPAEQEAGVHVVVLLHAPVIGGGTLLPEGPGGGKGAVIDNGLVVVLNDDVLLLVPFHILAVDLGTGVFGLPESADIKIIV